MAREAGVSTENVAEAFAALVEYWNGLKPRQGAGPA